MKQLTPKQIEFIESQPMFLVATAAEIGRVNVSPKGLDSLRVLGPDRIVWLNISGSGNETAAHVAATGRMTLLFMSFTDQPLLVRVYGTASVIHQRDEGWDALVGRFPTLGGTRQIFDLSIDLVTTSCGTSVPVMSIESLRADTELEPFYAEMSEDDLHDYWSRKNVTSLDGLPTHLFG